MWRALFLALGITTVIVGLECLVIDKAMLKASDGGPSPYAQAGPPPTRELVPPEWAPWALLSGGAVVVLYSFTIPKRVAGG